MWSIRLELFWTTNNLVSALVQASKAGVVKKESLVRAGKDYLYWPVTLSDGQALKGKDE